MQRLLAIDCDAREISFVLASVAGDRVTLEACESAPIATETQDSPLSPDKLGKQLQGLLARYKRSGAKVLLQVDRNAVELFEFSVPPASDAELPTLVANQVAMEAPGTADESIIDFIPHAAVGDEPRRISAAALSRAEFSRLNSICSAAGLSPDQMLMRSYATADLFLKYHKSDLGNVLLVNVIGDEVDLIVVNQTQALFFRTVRLPGELKNEAAVGRLLNEVRRTLLVAPQSASVAKPIEAVRVLGNSPEHQQLAEMISQQINVPAEKSDPLSGFLFAEGWENRSSGRLVPLLGMLVDDARHYQRTIDFLHPRRPPKPANRKRQVIIVGSLLAAMGLAGGYYVWDLFGAADAENKRLADELADLESLVKKTVEKKKVIDALDDWNNNSIVWLDELRDFSSKIPSGQDLVIQRLTMSPARGGRATIAFQGLAREPNVVTRMEATLRDPRHEVQTPRVDERVQDKSYTWNFETSISVSAAKPTAPVAEDPEKSTTATRTSRKKSAPKEGTSEPVAKESSRPGKKSKDNSKKDTASTKATAKDEKTPSDGKPQAERDVQAAIPEGSGR